MARWERPWVGRLAGVACVLLAAGNAHGLFLDDDQNINLRARIYSQFGIRTEDTSISENSDLVPNPPAAKAGQLVTNRNFFNPELDAKLTAYTNWMRGSFLDWLAPDDFRFRVAGWGFYDGIYDYGASQWNEAQKNINPNFGNYSKGICSQGPDKGKGCSSNADCASPGLCMPAGGWFVEASKFRVPQSGGCNPNRGQFCFVDSIGDLFPDGETKDPRTTYGFQRRVNELYLSYTKGPFFLRLGRQSISWGESDTIALLDQSNPFDITLSAPGLFQDIDEARIPLWTVRSSMNMFDVLGPFSSGFVEAYWVPGDIDINTGILPILAASPYSPRGRNPQFSSGFPNETFQFVLLDHVPRKKFENSRYGFRFQTVLNRAYTLQAWFYRTFPQAPVPRKAPLILVRPGTQGARTEQPICSVFADQGCSPLFIAETVRELTSVYGLAATFFVERIDGILRLNAQFFENEPAFIPEYNLNIGSPTGRSPVADEGTVPNADFIRWEVGFDRFFFFRPLNPTNSFTMSASQVGSYNLDETGLRDFRFSGQRKPGRDVLGRDPVPDDFVQMKPVEAFAQLTFLTDYMHGRLSPQVTWIQNFRGTYAFRPQVTYRWTDSLLFRLDYVMIGGEFQSFGFFRDRDQLTFRVTYQLN
jgi:hypothetical protein